MTRTTLIAIVAVLAALAGWTMYVVQSGQSTERERQQLARIDAAEQRATLAERERDDAVSALSRSEARLDGVRERESELDHRLDEIRAQLTAMSELRAKEREEFDELASRLREERDGLQQENQALTGKLAESRAAVESLEQVHEDLEQRLEQASAASASLEAGLVQARSAEQNLRNEFAASSIRQQRLQSELEQRISETQGERDRLASDNANLTEALEQATARVRALEESLEGLGNELAESEAARVELQDSLDQQSETPAGESVDAGELANLQAAYDALNLAHEQLKADLVDERNRRQDIGAALDDKLASLEDSTALLEQAKAERDRVSADLEAARSRAERTIELEARLREADEEIERRSDHLGAERTRVEQLEGELMALNQRRDELVQELEARESLVQRLNEERDDARRQLSRLRDEIEMVVEQKEAEVREIRERVTLIRMAGDIVYNIGSTRLRDEGARVLDSVADFALANPDRVVSLEGHTDSIPISVERRYLFPSNWELSAARAASAARYLQSRGVPAERLRIVGHGQYQPVQDNRSEEGRRANRRLEIVLAPDDALEEVISR
jgi:chemotaxis protein MotB